MQQSVMPVDTPVTGAVLVGYGGFLVDRDRAAEAEPLLRRALAAQESAFPQGHWRVTCARIALARCLFDLGQTGEAKRTLIETDLSPYWQSYRERQNALRRILALFEQWGWQERSASVRTLLGQES
jgi:hypothetical protein